MLRKKSEKGQAIILIVFSIIGIIGLTALTIDGGLAYSDRRSAQGAADSAAWAGGLSNARYVHPAGALLDEFEARKAAIIAAAQAIADQNGYIDDGTRSIVVVSVNSLPVKTPDNPNITLPDGSTIENPCPDYSSPNVEIVVDITSYVKTFFAPVIGVERVTNRVTAVTRACGTYKPAIFGGYAIASCGSGLNDQNPCSFDSGSSSSSDWTITGSGIHADTCIHVKDSGSVTLDAGQCLNSVGGATMGNGGEVASSACPTLGAISCTPEYLDSVMPENPCDGDAGDEGLPQSDRVIGTVVKEDGSTDSAIIFGDGIAPKVYCITDADALDGENIVLDNATLYFTQTTFNLKFAGGGGFSGTPSASGTYSSLAVVVAPSDTPCPGTSGSGANSAQQIEYRGNGAGEIYGTFLAPTACIDMRGNAGSGNDDTPLTVNGQVIANAVTSNGNASITINYVEDQNYRPPEDPTIILVK